MPETIAVIFTDLCGSTEMAGRLGPERADDLRREHFSLLRDAIGTHGGREVKTLGDGMMIGFDSASEALACAVTIQQGFELHNRDAEPDAEMLVRLGVSMGDVDSDEDDYFGTPVVEAARLCDLAQGGQILVSDLVRALAGGRGGHGFEVLGDRELKGLDAPIAVASVTWEPLENVATPTAFEIPMPNRLASATGAAFVGRAAERDRLDGHWKSAAAGSRRVMLLAGEAGVGKTTLAAELARTVHESGGVVLYGRCDEELVVPYGPWVEALEHLAAHVDDAGLRALLAGDARDVARLAPRVGDRVPDLAPTRSVDHGTERYLLHGAVVEMLRTLGHDVPVLLVLDDLHWAEASTLLLLRHALAAGDGLRLLVVGTYRDTDLGVDDALTDALAELHREEGFDRAALSGLADADVVALLEAVAGHELGDDGIAFAHDVYRETGGNPFFTGEILRHLAESGALYQEESGRWAVSADLRELGIPQSVREVVDRRVRRLGDDATRSLGAAALVGREFDVETVAAVLEVDEDALLDLFDAAVTAGIVAESPSAPGSTRSRTHCSRRCSTAGSPRRGAPDGTGARARSSRRPPARIRPESIFASSPITGPRQHVPRMSTRPSTTRGAPVTSPTTRSLRARLAGGTNEPSICSTRNTPTTPGPGRRSSPGSAPRRRRTMTLHSGGSC